MRLPMRLFACQTVLFSLSIAARDAGGQRLAALAYCRIASGMKTARMMTIQISE
jgi:hypothetical protein